MIRQKALIENALGVIGKPYAHGGRGPDAFDCIGLVMWLYGYQGHDLPDVVRHHDSPPIRDLFFVVSDPQPGDVVNWCDRGTDRNHVGIVVLIGGVRSVIHASSERGVCCDNERILRRACGHPKFTYYRLRELA